MSESRARLLAPLTVTLFTTPVVYLYMDPLQARVRGESLTRFRGGDPRAVGG